MTEEINGVVLRVSDRLTGSFQDFYQSQHRFFLWNRNIREPIDMNSIELPLNQDIPLADQCGHGKRWTETCSLCEIVSLRDSLAWMEPMVKRDRARLEKLLGAT